MPSSTPNLGLHKKDPVTDGNETFNIKTMLNDNWDKIDAAVGGIKVDIPDASLTAKGKVQLNDSTNSTSVTDAATPNAVKKAKEEVTVQSKAYTDQQIGLVTETGIPKLVSYPLLVTATTNNQTSFEIPLDTFDSNTDTLLVSINRATLDATQYTITNTVRNGSGMVTQRAKLNLLEGISKTSEVAMVVLKNVPIGAEGAINGAVLAEGSVPINRVNGLSEQLAETVTKADYVRSPAYAVTSGTSTAYTATLSPVPASIPAGFGITVVPHTECGANPTLNINGLGPVALKDQKGIAYTAAKLKAGMPYTFRRVGADFLADSAGGTGNAQPAQVESGFTFTNDGGEQTGTLSKRAFIDALVAKGVPATMEDPFNSLAAKIGQIPSSLKFASGQIGQSATIPYTISNLAFKPLLVVVRYSCSGSLNEVNGTAVGDALAYLDGSALRYGKEVALYMNGGSPQAASYLSVIFYSNSIALERAVPSSMKTWYDSYFVFGI
ncbi:phage tail protein [Paenibacillus sp. J22TS3]|uniref:phage tail protein n=1 Tax=Paenibacillus sp. J22TS3 TaxID=2807192 RepID=UPI001AFDB6FD|nr:phage tail protein [Paenibacillus sp. J22TS3]GIP20421.1 hypothetical protein J22TS3_06960 [Paenibacillus sp. J22TS3]